MTDQEKAYIEQEIRGSERRILDGVAKLLASRPAASGGLSGAKVLWGKKKGEPVESTTNEDIAYHVRGLRKNVDDPAKAKWRDQNVSDLAAFVAEAKRRGMPEGDESPDVPF